jgi:hypothetical protein
MLTRDSILTGARRLSAPAVPQPPPLAHQRQTVLNVLTVLLPDRLKTILAPLASIRAAPPSTEPECAFQKLPRKLRSERYWELNMEPVTLLLTALAMGAKAALKDTASLAVKDAYDGLKALIVRKFGNKASLESLAQRPESKAKQAAAEEDLVDAGAAADAEVMAKAREVVSAVERDDPATGAAMGIDFKGITAEFLKVGNIRSEGTGARLRDSQFIGGITLGDVTAGKPEPSKDP